MDPVEQRRANLHCSCRRGVVDCRRRPWRVSSRMNFNTSFSPMARVNSRCRASRFRHSAKRSLSSYSHSQGISLCTTWLRSGRCAPESAVCTICGKFDQASGLFIVHADDCAARDGSQPVSVHHQRRGASARARSRPVGAKQLPPVLRGVQDSNDGHTVGARLASARARNRSAIASPAFCHSAPPGRGAPRPV
jgi:hypothetical protein